MAGPEMLVLVLLLGSLAVPVGLWLLIGGLCYTVGVAFYAWKRLPFNHVVWHLFVIAGSISFFLGYALHLA